MVRKYIRKIAYFFGYNDSRIRKRIQKYRNDKAIKTRRKVGHKGLEIYGCEMLDQLYNAVSEANVHLWLEFGTLLGAYRDKGFIGFDYDCDTGVLASEYSLEFENILMKYGFLRKHGVFMVDRETGIEKLVELTFTYKGFEVDMSFSFIENNKRKIYLLCEPRTSHNDNEYELHEYVHDYPLPTSLVTINNHEYRAPNNVKGVLENTYGSTFMIPNPNWITTAQYDSVKILDFSKIYGKVYGKW